MSNVNATNSYNSLISSLTSSTTTSKNELTTEGFFKLLAAQLQNQDMSNPMDNSEMMTQMTQIAMMQAMSNFSTAMEDFSQINTISYGTSMMGKKVLLATADSSGELKKITGTVTRVDIFSGVPVLYIDNDEKTGYPISSVMSVFEEGHTPPADTGENKETEAGKETDKGTSSTETDSTGDK